MYYSYSEGTEELAGTGYQLALAYTRAAAEDKDAESEFYKLCRTPQCRPYQSSVTDVRVTHLPMCTLKLCSGV